MYQYCSTTNYSSYNYFNYYYYSKVKYPLYLKKKQEQISFSPPKKNLKNVNIKNQQKFRDPEVAEIKAGTIAIFQLTTNYFTVYSICICLYVG